MNVTQIFVSGINHNVDELLVGLVTQIHLRRKEAQGSKTACKVASLLSQTSYRYGFSNDHRFKIYLLHNILSPLPWTVSCVECKTIVANLILGFSECFLSSFV